jgi:hypothetical protein
MPGTISIFLRKLVNYVQLKIRSSQNYLEILTIISRTRLVLSVAMTHPYLFNDLRL